MSLNLTAATNGGVSASGKTAGCGPAVVGSSPAPHPNIKKMSYQSGARVDTAVSKSADMRNDRKSSNLFSGTTQERSSRGEQQSPKLKVRGSSPLAPAKSMHINN